MLKYEKIIRNLSLEEKVDLLLTDNFYCNSTIKNFEFPTFCISKNNNNEAFLSTDFPSDQSVASTWNCDLIQKAAMEISLFARDNVVVGVNGDFIGKDCDSYFNGQIASSYIKGINLGNAASCLLHLPDKVVDDENELRNKYLLPYEIAVKNAIPTIICCNSVNNTDILKEEWHAKGFTIVEVNDENKIIEALAKKNCLIYTEFDAKPIIIKAIEAYKKAKSDCVHEVISKEEFDKLELSYQILNPIIIDEILDDYFDGLASVDAAQFKKPLIEKSVFKKVADESIVLLKNDGVLPLDFTHKAAIYGQYAKDIIVNHNFNGQYDDVFASIDTVDFEAAGFAYGYHNDSDAGEFLEDALNLAKEATVAIVYLGIPSDSDEVELSDNQLKLIDTLYENNTKIIAVVTANKPINFSFIDKCNAVLYSKYLSSAGVKSTIDIIGGRVIPSGKLIEYLPLTNELEINVNDPSTYRFPFGYGLTYSIMDYKSFSIDRYGVEFTIHNTGSYDADEVVQMYIEYMEDGTAKTRNLRGFKKVSVKSGESVKVKLEFDDLTFRSYFEDKKCYGIKGGKYNVLIGRSVDQIEQSFVVCIEESYNQNSSVSDLILETTDYEDLKKFINEADITKYPKEDRGLSYKKKLIISIFVTLYFNIMLAIMLVSIYMNKGFTEGFIILAATLGIYDAGYIAYLIIISKNKNDITHLDINDEMTKYVDEMATFKTVASRVYPVPERQDEPIEEVEEEIVEEVVESVIEEPEEIFEEEIKPTYNVSSDYAVEYEEIKFSNNIHLEDYVKGFIDYCLANGLIIEPKSARMLFASLFASQLIFVRSTSYELLPLLTELLSKYLGSQQYEFSLDNVNTLDELIWNQNEDDSYSHTEFVNLLHYAKEAKNNIVLATLTDVNISSINEVFGNIMKYLLNPNDDYFVELGTEDKPYTFTIPRNLKMLVINDIKDLDNIPRNVAEGTLSIELNLRANAITSNNNLEISYLSYPKLNQLIHESKERNYLSEDLWKKIDDFEEGLNDLEPFRFENKSILIFEKYSAILMEIGSELDEVIDYIFASGVVPCIKSTKTYHNSKGENTIFTIIEKIFGEDTTPMTKRTIQKTE